MSEGSWRSITSAVGNLMIWAMLLACPASVRSGTPSETPPGEFELKAAFVLNFIRLVNWGTIPGEEISSELPVCALANSEFASAIRQTVSGKSAGRRSISFKITSSPDPLRCRTLIVDSAQYPAVRQAMTAVQDAPVLTIGNGPGFLAMGGIFELFVQDRKVQFDASLEAIRRAKLDVSARLLQLSRNLRKGAGGVD